MARKSSNLSKRENEQRQPHRAKSARASIAAALASPGILGGALLIVSLLALSGGPVGAYPSPPVPTPGASSSPTPAPPGNVLPFDSNLTFVLDAPVSSKQSRPGDLVAMHLKDPILVAGRIIAPAGTPGKLRIVSVSPADIGDVFGFVDIFFEPLVLSDGRLLPLRAPVARLEPRQTAGHESTVGLEDTIEDAVIPYHVLYHIFRKGKNFVLSPGSELPARTEATLTQLPNGAVAIETPRPLLDSRAVPKSSFPVQPAATPLQSQRPSGRKTPAPATTPSPTPSPSASP